MSAARKLNRAHIWNGWSNNYVHREEGYVIHAFDELENKRTKRFVSLCGVKIQDSGLCQLGENLWRPGCAKCCKILRKAGLLDENNNPQPQS